MLNKRDIINFLYLISFPCYGIGAYLAAAVSPAVGYIFAIFAHLMIIVFYAIDLAYKNEVKLRINWIYFLVVVMQLTCVVSLLISLSKNMPGLNMLGVVTKSVLLLVPFQAFVVVFLYNDKHKENFAKLTFNSWSLLLLINVVGFFGLGLSNEVHSIEGRVAFPFLDSFYSGASLVAILNLMLLFYIKKSWDNPLRITYLVAYFLINLAFLYYINSRLCLLIFIGVFIVFVFNITRRFRGVFLLSIFTLPILLNIGVFLYRILSLPVFAAIMQRVDLVDVTTFNGRSFLWQRALDWLMYDHRGLFFGNGANGQYSIHLIPDIAKLWFANEADLHLHSTVLMTLVDQGLFGYLLLLILTFQVFRHYRSEYQKNGYDAIFFPAAVFLIFLMQVDMFLYLGTLGYTILSVLAARVAVNLKSSLS